MNPQGASRGCEMRERDIMQEREGFWERGRLNRSDPVPNRESVPPRRRQKQGEEG